MALSVRDRVYEVGPCQEADLDDVVDIERRAFKAPWTRQIFLEELCREWAYLDVMRERPMDGTRERAVAFANYWLVRDEVHILNIATHTEQRRRGHATRLLVHVLEFAARHRCKYVTLEVRRSNQVALGLYRAHGFRVVGVRPNYYVEDREDAIVMLFEFDPADPNRREHSGDPRERDPE